MSRKKRNKLVFYVNKTSPKSKAHMWLGSDTRCGIVAAGGITNPDNYEVTKVIHGQGICWNCTHGKKHAATYQQHQDIETLKEVSVP